MAADDDIDYSMFSKENLSVGFKNLSRRFPGFNAQKIDGNAIGIFVALEVDWNSRHSGIYFIYTAIAIAKISKTDQFVIIDVKRDKAHTVYEYANITFDFIKKIHAQYRNVFENISFFIAYEISEPIEQFYGEMCGFLDPNSRFYMPFDLNVFMMPDLVIKDNSEKNKYSPQFKHQNTGGFSCKKPKKVFSLFSKLIKNRSLFCLMNDQEGECPNFKMLKSQFTTLEVTPPTVYICNDDNINDDLINLLIYGCYVMSKHMDAISEREMETRMEKLSLKPNAVKDDEDIDA